MGYFSFGIRTRLFNTDEAKADTSEDFGRGFEPDKSAALGRG